MKISIASDHAGFEQKQALVGYANVVAVSGRFVDESVNREILDAFVSTSFGGGRHAGRVEKIAALENE